MALIVNTNIASLNAQRNLGLNNDRLSKSIERLSSGLRINSAADDAAGLSIATKFAAQVRGIAQAVRNANNAISLVQVAEGGINTATNILQRLRELAVQAASDDNTASDRLILKKEVDNLVAELTRISDTSEFNGQKLLDGTFTNKLFQVGPNSGQTLSLSITTLKTVGQASSTAVGTADLTADIQDGILNAAGAEFVAGDFTVAGTDIVATKASDDTFSVLTIQTNGIAGDDDAATSGLSGLDFTINGTTVTVAFTSDVGDLNDNQIATDIVSAINTAIDATALSIVITATVVNGSAFTITATGGESLKLAIGSVTTDAASDVAAITGTLGFGAASAMFGSGTTNEEIENFNGESSAIAKAVAINSLTATTGVTATAQQTTITADNDFTDSSLASGDLFINGISIGASTTTLTSLIDAINLKTNDTGVTASQDTGGTKLVLTASDGRNITLTAKDSTIGVTNLGFANSNFTNNVLVVRGKIDLTSASTFQLEASTGDLTDLDDSFTTDQSVTKSDDVITDLGDITGIQVDTQVNATLALTAIDVALNDVNNLRADLGALQNRIQFTVSNLVIAGENTKAAESRVRDADFAIEVAIFTKNQILVQAGAAMLAQANSLPQIALTLLG